MQIAMITWFALLASIGQLDARTYLYVSRFDSHNGYHAVVRGFNAALYDANGKALGSISPLRSISVGERAFWYVPRDSDDICSFSFGTPNSRKCVHAPKHPGEMSALKFYNGAIYFFADSFHRVKGRYGHYYDLFRMDETTREVRAVSRDHFFTLPPQWCIGNALEYMYLDGESARLDGIRKFSLPGGDRRNLFLSESCAVNGNAIAVADAPRLIVDGKVTSFPSAGLVFPFKDGWLVQSGTEFKVYSRLGDRELESGSMGHDFVLHSDGGRFFLINFGRRP